MARILIGNIKGPRGPQGIQGIQGPVGPQGPQGPLPPLINNFLATEAGVGALDAVAGATLKAQLDEVNGDLSLNVSNASLIDSILPILNTLGKTCSGFFRETTDLTTQAQGYAYGFTAYRIHEKAIRVMANRVYSGIIELYDYEIDKSAWSYKGSLLSDLQQAPTTVTTTRTENPYI